MAKQTDTSLRNHVIYSIFVRNFSEEGNFQGVIPQLDRIKDLSVDTIWFLPFYPIGEAQRKGLEGSPYAIKNYREVDPNYGSMQDLDQLIDEIHSREMKVMIDIVFNHTSPDSYLVKNHPEWFYKTPEGWLGNRVGEWWDIVDLDYDNEGLWQDQIETLRFWAEKVDGFRCDVAPLIPIEFWVQARQEVEEVNPDLIWLSESVHPGFIRHLRSRGLIAHSDSEIYQAFDMTYDYDVRDEFEAYLKGEIPLSLYIYRLNLQDVIFPSNYIKMRNLENHDNPRAKHLIRNDQDLRQWTAFTYFQKGSTLIYNGQEVMADREPSLFDMDLIKWNWNQDMSPLLKRLGEINKLIDMNDLYTLTAHDELDTVVGTYKNEDEQVQWLGIFNLKSAKGEVPVDLEDGEYENLVTGKIVEIRDQKIEVRENPIIIQSKN